MRRGVFSMEVLLVAAALAGCGGKGDQEQAAANADTARAAPLAAGEPAGQPAIMARPRDTTATGVVRVVGADPITQIVLMPDTSKRARPVALHGALDDELDHLQGAMLQVWGRVVPNEPPSPALAIDVTRYRIVAINGVRPLVGVLRVGPNGVQLVGDSTMTIQSPSAGLLSLQGAKLWVIGRTQSGRLVVESYGVIRQSQE